MNPWDTKLISELTESEMVGYARYLEEQMLVERAEYVEKAVEFCMEQWQAARGDQSKALAFSQLGHSGPYRFNLPTGRHRRPMGWYSEDAAVPQTPILTSYASVHVLLPPWLDPEMARYIAREQIIEQTEPDY